MKSKIPTFTSSEPTCTTITFFLLQLWWPEFVSCKLLIVVLVTGHFYSFTTEFLIQLWCTHPHYQRNCSEIFSPTPDILIQQHQIITGWDTDCLVTRHQTMVVSCSRVSPESLSPPAMTDWLEKIIALQKIGEKQEILRSTSEIICLITFTDTHGFFQVWFVCHSVFPFLLKLIFSRHNVDEML